MTKIILCFLGTLMVDVINKYLVIVESSNEKALILSDV